MNIPQKNVVKGLVAEDTGKLLVLRRTLDQRWNPGGWDFVGDKAEGDETTKQTLERESDEELNHNNRGFQVTWNDESVARLSEIDHEPYQEVVTTMHEGIVYQVEPEPSLDPEAHSEALWLPPSKLRVLRGLPEIFLDQIKDMDLEGVRARSELTF